MIRPATAGDLASVMSLAWLMRQESPVYAALPWDGERVVGVFSRLLDREWLLVAQDEPPESEVVGFFALVIDADPWTGVWCARDMALYVVLHARHRGIGRDLVDAACATAARSGCRWLQVGSTVGTGEDAARAAYAAAGFKPAGFLMRKVLESSTGRPECPPQT